MIRLLLLAVLGALWLLPLAWMVARAAGAVREDRLALGRPGGEAFARPLGDARWAWANLDALAVAALVAALAVAFAVPAAWACARRRDPVTRALFGGLLLGYAVPAALVGPPVARLAAGAGLSGPLPSIVLTHLVFAVPAAAWILEGYMARLPRGLDDARRLDGVSLPRFLAGVIVPRVRGGLAAAGLFTFALSFGAAAPDPAVPPDGRVDLTAATAAATLHLLPIGVAVVCLRGALSRAVSLGRV
jgi:multiple sugar transport system permease protein